MELQNKRQKVETTKNLSDLPEHVLRVIFEYIETKELHFSLRNVNKTFRKQIDGYILPLGLFAFNQIAYESVPTKLLYVFKRGTKYVKTISSIDGCFPFVENLSVSRIGLNQLQLYSFSPPTAEPDMKYFIGIHSVIQQGPSIVSSACNLTITLASLYGFNLTKYKWKPLKRNCVGYAYGMEEYCPIGNSAVIVFPDDIGKYRTAFLKTFSSDIHMLSSFQATGTQEHSKPEQYSLVLPDEICSIRDFSLIRSSENSVMIIGGYNRMQPSGLEYLKYNSVFWQGVLLNYNKTVQWRPINVQKMGMRIKPIIFKLKDNIYILGAPPKSNTRPDYYFNNIKNPCCYNFPKNCTCCDMYDCKEETLYRKKYVLPYSLSWDNSVKIATDENDQFAVFIFSTLTRDRDIKSCTYRECAGCISTTTEDKGDNKMLIFTEAGGFQEINDYENDLDEFPLDKCSSLIFVHK